MGAHALRTVTLSHAYVQQGIPETLARRWQISLTVIRETAQTMVVTKPGSAQTAL